MNDPFHEHCPEPYPACVLSRFRWDGSSVKVHPRGTMPHIGPPCLCTPALLQATSDEGGMLSTRLVRGPWIPPGAGGSGGRGGCTGARLALPVLSSPPFVSSARSTAHLLTGTWLLGGNSPLQPYLCSLLMLLDVLGLVWRAHRPWPHISHGRVTLWHEGVQTLRHSPSHWCVPTDRNSSRAWWGPCSPRDLLWVRSL